MSCDSFNSLRAAQHSIGVMLQYAVARHSKSSNDCTSLNAMAETIVYIDHSSNRSVCDWKGYSGWGKMQESVLRGRQVKMEKTQIA